LQDSNINVALVENNDCLLFSKRISEMVNRANVLNFSRTRFTEEEIIEQISAQAGKTNYAVFAWDKYGYYGLVGYFSIERFNLTWQLNHFVFSCRTLTMGIENFFAKYIQETLKYPVNWKYNPVDISGNYDYIKLHKYKDVQNYIREQEGIAPYPDNYSAKIYAWCHSPIYWILTEQTHRIDY
jgi:predicted enzyme involved in methoxymalonyl-ACP biosynthesis